MKLPNGRVPPGGWWHEMGPGVTLRAATRELLVKTIFENKLRNNLPQGDIEREIDDQYCAKYPDACHKEPSDYGKVNPPSGSGETMLNRVSRWAAFTAAKMPQGGVPLIGEAEATRRGEICAHCPMNVPWRGSCAGCSRSTATLLMQIKGLRKNPWDGKVWGCSVIGWENSVAINGQHEFLPVTDSQRAALPDRCWRKALLP